MVEAVKELQSIQFKERDAALAEFSDLNVGEEIFNFIQWILPEEFFEQIPLRKLFGTDLGVGKELLWGEFLKAIREQVTKMQPEERLQSMRKVLGFFREHPIAINPGRVSEFLRDVYTDEAILGLPEDEQTSQLIRYIQDAVSILDAALIAGGLKALFRGAIRAPSLAAANKVNREMTQHLVYNV